MAPVLKNLLTHCIQVITEKIIWIYTELIFCNRSTQDFNTLNIDNKTMKSSITYGKLHLVLEPEPPSSAWISALNKILCFQWGVICYCRKRKKTHLFQFHSKSGWTIQGVVRDQFCLRLCGFSLRKRCYNICQDAYDSNQSTSFKNFFRQIFINARSGISETCYVISSHRDELMCKASVESHAIP